jgi:DNA-binding CsgD family transcriptional regulator
MTIEQENALLQTVRPVALGFGAVARAVGSSGFPELLGRVLEGLVPADEVVITRFAEKPVAELFSQRIKKYPEDEKAYLAGAYLLDPYYRAGLDSGFSGFSTYTNLAPEGFFASAYYKRYLVKVGLVDECGYLLQFANGQFINISLGRHEGLGPFTTAELDLLEALEPLINPLCQLHWGQLFARDSGQGQLNRQLDEALTNFASSRLTRRECEVIRLLLQGHSSNSIADKLHISPETVRLHRRNSYRKLEIGSQSELFNLFIDSLLRFESYEGGDPLAGYY